MDGFKKFILRGNVVDLAVGVVIGAAFGVVITNFTTNVLSPFIGLFGSGNFDSLTWCVKSPCGVDPATGAYTGHVLAYGTVLTALLSFIITAAVIYFFVVKPVGRLMDKMKTEPAAAATTKDCSECLSAIPLAATRCAFCTVEQ